ncbi:MAG: TIGR04211 family SH3 domain-containing protein [Gammaproteobacteria bacterium]
MSETNERYVTDELEITLHRSMSLSSEIIAQIKSGTPVVVLQTNRDEGYVKVSTQDKKVGWMLESYLISEPAGRQQLEVLKKEYNLLKENFDAQVKVRTAKLSTELSQVKSAAKRPLELQQENQKLKKILEEERAQVVNIKQENSEFKSIYKDRQWFITGAITAIGSLVLGLVLTRVPWRRRKSWGEL